MSRVPRGVRFFKLERLVMDRLRSGRFGKDRVGDVARSGSCRLADVLEVRVLSSETNASANGAQDEVKYKFERRSSVKR